jgi:hypothetical protein
MAQHWRRYVAAGALVALFAFASASTASAAFPGANGRIAYGTVDLGSQRWSIHTVLPDGSGDQIRLSLLQPVNGCRVGSPAATEPRMSPGRAESHS